MQHSPLPWRITDATEKKGREIVDARGNTVAKLTALDIPNAEVIVAGTGLLVQGIKHITDPEELELGREYWLRPKDSPCVPYVAVCEQEFGRKYFGLRIWAESNNNQAMRRWDIFGPLPVRNPPDFYALMAG